jgi:Ca2+:H+ antiporter
VVEAAHPESGVSVPRRETLWRVLPVVALIVAGVAALLGARLQMLGAVWVILEFVVLIGAVFASVHHADVIAHRTGEPYGTLVLTVAVTVIEVALILSIMLAGAGSSELARDTVFAVLMIVCNGLVGLCLIVGGFRYGEQGFQLPGTNSYLVVLMPLATLALILPNYTVTTPGPFYSALQLGVVSVATLVLYGVFLYVQTVRHRDYFLSDAGTPDESHDVPSMAQVWESVVLLLVALAAVVLLAKSVSVPVGAGMAALGAPAGLIGLLVALVVLLPESLSALRAARANDLQKSLNLALGSSLATIGLTIPAVAVLSVAMNYKLALGLHIMDTILLVLTFAISLVTFGGPRTNILPGLVHLGLFVLYVCLLFAP